MSILEKQLAVESATDGEENASISQLVNLIADQSDSNVCNGDDFKS